MNYLKYFKRLIMFKKYPLFRTIPFKYLLLNILIIGILLAIPNVMSLLNTNQFASILTEAQSEIPKFEIKNGKYVGEEKNIRVGQDTIVFTNEEVSSKDSLIAFTKKGVNINGYHEETLPYTSFDKFNNDEELKQYVKTQSSSAVFFFIVYSTIQILVLATFSFIILLLSSFLLDYLSKLKMKRTDYMNWFKIISYTFVIPTILLTIIDLVFKNQFWIIYIIVIPFLYYYYKKLPLFKKKAKSRS